jgi:uncharacterized protein (DUF934 family)
MVDPPSQIRVPATQVHDRGHGRGYSTARLLRERGGYAGELRAIGDVQRDQLCCVHESGLNAFALPDDQDAVAALEGLRNFSDGYQSTQLRAPWFRSRVADAPRAQDPSA